MGFAVSKFAAHGTRVGPTEEDVPTYLDHKGLIICVGLGIVLLILIMVAVAIFYK
jgi:hypothetical protein